MKSSQKVESFTKNPIPNFTSRRNCITKYQHWSIKNLGVMKNSEELKKCWSSYVVRSRCHQRWSPHHSGTARPEQQTLQVQRVEAGFSRGFLPTFEPGRSSGHHHDPSGFLHSQDDNHLIQSASRYVPNLRPPDSPLSLVEYGNLWDLQQETLDTCPSIIYLWPPSILVGWCWLYSHLHESSWCSVLKCPKEIDLTFIDDRCLCTLW